MSKRLLTPSETFSVVFGSQVCFGFLMCFPVTVIKGIVLPLTSTTATFTRTFGGPIGHEISVSLEALGTLPTRRGEYNCNRYVERTCIWASEKPSKAWIHKGYWIGFYV